MATKISKVYTEIKRWYIFILMFSENRFVINATSQADMRNVYKDHYNEKLNLTKKLFAEDKSKEYLPEMFILEEYESTKQMVFSREIAWAKLLQEAGYVCANGETFEDYMEDILPISQGFYDEIKGTDVSELLAEEKSLFPNYGSRGKNKPDNYGKHQVLLRFTEEEFEHIKKRTKEADLVNVSSYCYLMAMQGEIIALENPYKYEYLGEIRACINTMKQSIVTIYGLGQYFPYDLARIQECVDTVTKQYKAILKCSIKNYNEIAKHRDAWRKKK